jgi:hypothetical protein
MIARQSVVIAQVDADIPTGKYIPPLRADTVIEPVSRGAQRITCRTEKRI